MSEITISDSQREEMEHALGLNYDSKPTRNYFYTDVDDKGWNDLVTKGLAVKRPGWDDERVYFLLTESGKSMVYKEDGEEE